VLRQWLSRAAFWLIPAKLFCFPVNLPANKVTNPPDGQNICEKQTKKKIGIICSRREILSPDNHIEEEDPCREK